MESELATRQRDDRHRRARYDGRGRGRRIGCHTKTSAARRSAGPLATPAPLTAHRPSLHSTSERGSGTPAGSLRASATPCCPLPSAKGGPLVRRRIHIMKRLTLTVMAGTLVACQTVDLTPTAITAQSESARAVAAGGATLDPVLTKQLTTAS